MREFRKAIPVHHTATTDSSWDGPANEARLKLDQDADYYWRAYAWQDPDGDPKTKAAYRFIHHEVDSEGNIGAANVNACQTGIGVLNGGRGGTTIPEADRRGVYEHLSAHLRDAGLEPPELKSRAATGQVERRAFPLVSVEVRTSNAGGPKLVGHAAVFDTPTEIGGFFGGFTEIVRKGAFAKTIRESDIRALWNHDPNWVLGRNKAGTLSLAEDDKGLAIEITPPDTQWARDLVTTIQRGDVDQMSFGFTPTREAWNNDTDTRELLEVRLWDVSPVTFPAYEETDIGVRSALAAIGINFDALARVIARSQRGLPLLAAEREILEASIDGLTACLRGTPGETPHLPPAPAAVSLDLLRRRLELAARS